MLRKVVPARGWRRYATAGLVVALGLSGAVATVTALPAQAAHSKSVQSAPPLSPKLPGFRQGMVTVTGDTIHYVIGGSGPVLVLIHGWPMTWWEWHTVMPSLARAHTVIAFDLPGLGDSTVPAGTGYTTADAAVLLHEAVTALGFSRVSLLSHDLGVGIAYAYAVLYRHSVARLGVLESMLNGFGLESIYGFSFHFDLNMAPPPTPEGIVNNHASEVAYLNYLYHFAHKPGAITTQDRSVWYAAYASAANREAGYNYYRAFPKDEAWDIKHATTKLTIPVLAMGGADSFGTATATSMDGVATDVHAVVAPDAGHYIPEEDPVFLSECANVFFSSSATPHAPPGFEECLP
ncbi:MAG TPA: alpha/beta hydrolase [Streptosporangiaceae bacterium]|jgi:pimeloyl-ACP methyl ester carboxylesterase